METAFRTATKLCLFREEWKRYDAYSKCIADFGDHSLPLRLHLSNPSSGFDAEEGIGETAWEALPACKISR